MDLLAARTLTYNKLTQKQEISSSAETYTTQRMSST